jgi:hypothetical protein
LPSAGDADVRRLGRFLAISIAGIAVIVALQIIAIDSPSLRFPYAGYVFTVLILSGLWSANRLFRDHEGAGKNGSFAKTAGLAVAASGLLYSLVYAVSFGCCGVEGIRFTNANVLVIVAVGVFLTLVISFLRRRRP